MLRAKDSDTICAVATPAGLGGISVIRISGPNALVVTSKVSKKFPSKPESHRAYFCNIVDPASGNVVDEVLITYFADGRSFTGEESLEISCHGSPFICESIIKLLVSEGSRVADRGEFTYRAFMNGKIDLVQAESVLATIESQSRLSAQLAVRQLQGELSKKIQAIEDKMTWLAAHIEAGIDFSAEDIEIIERSLLISKLQEILALLNPLVDSFKVGRVLKDGLRVVLVGAPNVGKSSLLNSLLEDEKAIVTDIPGTTRDLLDGDVIYEGLKYTFVDTAGLRKADDVVEKIGIERSYKALESADAVLFVFDSSKAINPSELEGLKAVGKSKLWLIGNKVDLTSSSGAKESALAVLDTSKFFTDSVERGVFLESRMLFVSALDKFARSEILSALGSAYKDFSQESSAALSNARHFENMSIASGNIVRALEVAKSGEGAEFLAFELKEALMKIHETLGRRFDDEIMDRVFKEFCIGK